MQIMSACLAKLVFVFRCSISQALDASVAAHVGATRLWGWRAAVFWVNVEPCMCR